MIDISAELEFKTARSGGKGGQNVNKVETAVEARWNIAASHLLNDEEKLRIRTYLAARINKEGTLIVKSTESRSQLENKSITIRKINELVNKSLIVRKKRLKTKIPRGVIEKRLENKKRQSDKKKDRNRFFE